MDRQSTEQLDSIYKIYKKVTYQTLKSLGYTYTQRSMYVEGKNSRKYVLMELRDEGERNPEFCFLLNFETKKGLVLPNPFNHYIDNPIC